jgi:hypothetical protein
MAEELRSDCSAKTCGLSENQMIKIIQNRATGALARPRGNVRTSINHKGHEVTQRYKYPRVASWSFVSWVNKTPHYDAAVEGEAAVLTPYFSEISTLARVFSHSIRSMHLPPAGSKATVKFSTGAAVFETLIGTRARSSFSPG